jgi:hypothetical protein
MSGYLRDLLEFVGLANGVTITPTKGERMDRMSHSVTKQDGSQVKSILKLRRSQSAKKVSFGRDEVIF